MLKKLAEGQRKVNTRTKMQVLWQFVSFFPGTGKRTEHFTANKSVGTCYPVTNKLCC